MLWYMWVQCVCSLPCCSVRDCRGYFIKVHLPACLRPNHPPSKSHLYQTPGTLRPFLLLLTLYCNSLQWGSVKQQKHVSGMGGLCLSHYTDSHRNVGLLSDLNPNAIYAGPLPLTHPHVFICSSVTVTLMICTSDEKIEAVLQSQSFSQNLCIITCAISTFDCQMKRCWLS